jgi:multicomponent Na+:H+ antiporter subunit D
VVTIGLLPLIRLEAFSPDMQHILRIVGFGSVFAGLMLAFFQKDIKRLLACSTISQVGFVLIAPAAAPMYAFAHGVAKAVLFLCAGNLPERNLVKLKRVAVDWSLAWPMRLAALSIAGCPLLLGYAAKYASGAPFTGWSQWIIIWASLGTAAILSPIILISSTSNTGTRIRGWQSPVFMASLLLFTGLFFSPYKWDALLKAVVVLAVGGLLHHFLTHRLMRVALPAGWEKLEHVVGMICITTLLLILGVYSL